MPSWKRVIAPDVPELPVFAHAAIAGDQIYVSGMLGLTDDFEGVVEGGIGPETTQAFRHVQRILAACDATLADIVKVSAYLPDLREWEAMNSAYLEVFGSRRRPASRSAAATCCWARASSSTASPTSREPDRLPHLPRRRGPDRRRVRAARRCRGRTR
jgi:enamine deaminase RidA (YjgF/YER057c/UK114 family)